MQNKKIELPTTQRQLVALLKRVEANVYRKCAENASVTHRTPTAAELASDFQAFAADRDEAAKYAEKDGALGATFEELRRMYGESTSS